MEHKYVLFLLNVESTTLYEMEHKYVLFLLNVEF